MTDAQFNGLLLLAVLLGLIGILLVMSIAFAGL